MLAVILIFLAGLVTGFLLTSYMDRKMLNTAIKHLQDAVRLHERCFELKVEIEAAEGRVREKIEFLKRVAGV